MEIYEYLTYISLNTFILAFPVLCGLCTVYEISFSLSFIVEKIAPPPPASCKVISLISDVSSSVIAGIYNQALSRCPCSCLIVHGVSSCSDSSGTSSKNMTLVSTTPLRTRVSPFCGDFLSLRSSPQGHVSVPDPLLSSGTLADRAEDNVDEKHSRTSSREEGAWRFCTINIHFKLKPLNSIFFSSYLSQRSQAVCRDWEWSPIRRNICGVSQKIILGPLLFLLDIHDLPRFTSDVKTYLSVDDSLFW